MAATILSPMGYNPYRKFRARRADYVLIVAAVVVAAALLIWAVFG